MTTILYIHGFNSAGTTFKSQALRTELPNYKIISPTFDYKQFDLALKLLRSTFITNKIDIVVGTSAGGFMALYASAKYHCKCIAINPVTHLTDTLKRFLGENQNYITKQKYVITEQDIEKCRRFEEDEFSKIVLTDENTRFLLSNDDELLGDHHYLEEKYPQCHHFKYFDGYGHRFTSIKPIVAEIKEYLKK